MRKYIFYISFPSFSQINLLIIYARIIHYQNQCQNILPMLFSWSLTHLTTLTTPITLTTPTIPTTPITLVKRLPLILILFLNPIMKPVTK